MTKSTITREQLLEIIETDHVQCGEASYLARMALAAMVSESGCLPLDYLQGHKDGLEWAARLAEANHPETGDWLYDDPIELAKAIRKGQDMPPAQPAPVELANIALPHSWLDGEGVEVMSANEVKRACRAAMLRAGNSPVVPDERAAFNAWNNDVDCPLAGRDAKSAAWLAWQSRAAMLAAAPQEVK